MQTKSETTTQEPTKKNKTPATYEVVVCVKNTNNENGPGHVSGFTSKKRDGQTSITHTSYFPGAVGSLINGFTFGSVPVPGQLEPKHEQDLKEADHVLKATLTKDQYKQMKKAQKEFSQEVESGQRTYSVFSTSNPLASFFPNVLRGGTGAKLVKEKLGCEPPEDHFGMPVYDNDHPKVPKLKVDNCASSVTHLLKKGGFKFENPKIPTFFTPALQELGFEEVSKSMFSAKK
ncbi:hypothetical protein Lwal_3172 [Legionella waltersii]|uniref:Uncharacterized protein n=2 Tax=Legionella waltersii TaxID=66969 RepID=A0A0W1A1B0_9GAMM|nr:hypothetical protein Lwal_3172 [Legionella waltersii]SNV04906.1 Uncharacterised protein [Legionella waltersii]